MWGISGKPLNRAFRRCMGWGGSGTIFFRKLAVTVDRLGVFLPVLIRFQTDCTALLPPLLQHMGI